MGRRLRRDWGGDERGGWGGVGEVVGRGGEEREGV